MATPKALPGMIQIIDQNYNFNYNETQEFVEQLKEYSSANSHYTVISIIGPQSSGKSSLLNTLFGTNFEVLPPEKWQQTFKGMWIAKCINPCMIIMDVEGFDGRERAHQVDTLFERRSGLFALTVSDVLLLNMWFIDIRRQQGGNIGFIKLIFEERLKIDAPQKKTILIIVVRDHNNDQYPAYKTEKDLECTMNELWLEVHPAKTKKNMSDYVQVIVECFPNKLYEAEKFAQKSKDLADLLCRFAKDGSLKQNLCPSSFAYLSRMIWKNICENKKVTAADNELSLSAYMCDQTLKEMLCSLEKGEIMKIDKTKSVKEFNAKLLLFLTGIVDRYEKETTSFDMNIREEKKVQLETKVLEKFGETFKDKVKKLCDHTYDPSYLHDELNKLNELEESDISILIREDFIAKFDNETLPDLNPYFQKILEKRREKLQEDLMEKAKEDAKYIQIEREVKKALKVTSHV